jgi:hypothetical protein
MVSAANRLFACCLSLSFSFACFVHQHRGKDWRNVIYFAETKLGPVSKAQGKSCGVRVLSTQPSSLPL